MADEFKKPDRGVYWARHTKQGCNLVYAIDSNGEEVRRYRVTHPSREAAAVAHLWELLDVVDPIPMLQLVSERDDRPMRALPNVARRSISDVYDPYNPPPLPFRRQG